MTGESAGVASVERALQLMEELLNGPVGATALASQHSVVSVATVGAVWPAHACSSWLAFLADDPALLETYLDQPLHGPTDQTVTDPEALRRLVAQYRAAGYAVNRGFWRDGVSAVGAVVHDASGKAVAALSAMMPEFRLADAGAENLGRLVAEVAERASVRLGYRGR